MPLRMTRYFSVALPLVGSAILLFSCERGVPAAAPAEELPHDRVQREPFHRQFAERAAFLPFRHAPYGGLFAGRRALPRVPQRVSITTYKDDSLSTVDAVLTANYAIYYEKRRLWEAKGDVVVEKSDGKSSSPSSCSGTSGPSGFIPTSIPKSSSPAVRTSSSARVSESDEEFRDWRFRRMKGRMEVDVVPGSQADSAAKPVASAEKKPAPRVSAEKASVQKRPPSAQTRKGPISGSPSRSRPSGSVSLQRHARPLSAEPDTRSSEFRDR